MGLIIDELQAGSFMLRLCARKSKLERFEPSICTVDVEQPLSRSSGVELSVESVNTLNTQHEIGVLSVEC